MVRLTADAAVLVLLVVAAACAPIGRLRDALAPSTPYDNYVATLRTAGLHHTSLGGAWITAGQQALSTTETVTLPHRGSEVVRADQPSVVSYRVELRRGQVYELHLDADRAAHVDAFGDVFRLVPGRDPEHVAGVGPPSRHLAYEPEEDGMFLVRIQPELLDHGRLALAQRQRAALLFPVARHGRRHIQSLFGAARDRGAREHHGIDIFAPKGTPAIAAADGWVTSTTPNRLGGNVVWLWDPRRGQTLYYAHLDRTSVFPGQRLNRGDVLGFVGNTGNARHTSPHLHFGIYRRRLGPIDPLHYVVDHAR